MAGRWKWAAPVLRSITPLTGALVGAVALITAILSLVFAELKFGHPSSTSGLAILAVPPAAALGACVGGVLAALLREAVRRQIPLGPTDWRVVTTAVLLVIAAVSVGAVGAVFTRELRRPRVIHSTGSIARAYGASPLTPSREGVLVWSRQAPSEHPVQGLEWNRETAHVSITDDQLLVRSGQTRSAGVDLSPFDYAGEAYAVPARLTGGSESLAVLLHLRGTTGLDLLLIFDPAGHLVHQELLKRGWQVPRVGLGVAGASTERQEILVNRGTLLRYVSSGYVPP